MAIPNSVSTTPREGFFLLGQFAITESKRVMEHPAGIGGMPQSNGIAQRLDSWLAKHADMPGADSLVSMLQFAIETFGFDPDAFVHEYLMWAMCGEPKPSGKFDIYAVEGGTAAMCYIFKSLKANRLLHPGDTTALGTPIFTPYLELTHLEDYDLKVVHVRAPQENRFQYTNAELKKLEDPNIKAFFIVNPGNPSGMGIDKETIGKIAKLVKTKRPNLMLLTDDVYGTFVHGFRSLLGELPQNTIGVYSYSKYFGCTGRRLGTIAIHDGQYLRPDDRKAAGQARSGAGQKIWTADARAAQAQVHRSHRRGQSRRGPQPHSRPLASTVGDDEPVLACRDDGYKE